MPRSTAEKRDSLPLPAPKLWGGKVVGCRGLDSQRNLGTRGRKQPQGSWTRNTVSELRGLESRGVCREHMWSFSWVTQHTCMSFPPLLQQQPQTERLNTTKARSYLQTCKTKVLGRAAFLPEALGKNSVFLSATRGARVPGLTTPSSHHPPSCSQQHTSNYGWELHASLL